jgi:hypothetical protein
MLRQAQHDNLFVATREASDGLFARIFSRLTLNPHEEEASDGCLLEYSAV